MGGTFQKTSYWNFPLYLPLYFRSKRPHPGVPSSHIFSTFILILFTNHTFSPDHCKNLFVFSFLFTFVEPFEPVLYCTV
jgi:hypothetical protein